MFDLIIIGAGPSGATLARLLADKYKILVIDRRSFEKKSEAVEKICGGLIAPDAQKILSCMNIGLPKKVLTDPQVFSVKTIDFDNNLEKYFQRFYINIDRGEFDRFLFNKIPSTVIFRGSSVVKKIIKNGNGYTLEFVSNKKKYSEKAKIVIGADGANSILRKKLFGNIVNPQSMYYSIQEEFYLKEPLPYYTAIFDKQVTDYYSWIIPKQERILIGSAFQLNKHISGNYNLLLKKLQKYGFNLDNKLQRKGAFLQRPTGARDIFLGRDNAYLVGEAAGFVSPSSGEGLSYAFKSAIALAKAFTENRVGGEVLSRYKKNTAKLGFNIMWKNLKSIGMYNSYLRKLILKSGIGSLDMVEEGLKK